MTAGLQLLKMPDRERWSVYLGPSVGLGAESVVLVPEEGDLVGGYERARRALSPGRRTRLIGRGVTDPDQWPPWLTASALTGPLVLTELDAYLPVDRSALLEPLVAGVETWLDRNLGGVIEDLEASRVFRATFTNRLLLNAFSMLPLVFGVRHHHSRDTVLCEDAELASFLAEDTPKPSPRRDRMAFALRLAGWTSLALVGTMARRAWEYARELPSRRFLRQADRGGEPSVLVGLIGSWPYACRHVLEALGPSTRRVGVLLQDTLRVGAQSDHVAAQLKDPSAVFPSLGEGALQGRMDSVEQCVSVTSVSALVTCMAASAQGTLIAASRVAHSGPCLRVGHTQMRVDHDLRALSRLLTIDLLRANEAYRATSALLQRHDYRGRIVVWPHASNPSVAVPDLLLQRAGATTVELVHGAFADRQGLFTYAYSNSSVRATWTQVEAAFLEPHARGQRCIGGFVPRSKPSRRTPRAPRRVLALTNYGAGVFGPRQTHYSRLAHYQRDFFDALSGAVSAVGSLEVRWRPHPNDDPRSFAPILDSGRYVAPELSYRTRSLQEDLTWADIVVSSWSSSLVEALMHPVAVFLHVVPFYEGVGVFEAVAPERRFTHRGDLVAKFPACVAALEVDGERALRPEALLRRAFFGDAGRPRALDDLIEELGVAVGASQGPGLAT